MTSDLSMELYWYIVVIVFIVIKIFFYVCWYRSRQRQLAAYLNNPRNSQIVIVGGRAYLHHMCERQNTSIWPSWYGVQDEGSVGEPSASLPPAAVSFSHLDMPPPYQAVSGADDLKPPPYSEVAHSDDVEASRTAPLPILPPSLFEGEDSASIISEAPPPYTPSPNRQEGPVNLSQSHSEDRPN